MLIVLAVLLVPLLITVLGGLAALWPRGDQSRFLPEDARYSAPGVTTEVATVSRVDRWVWAFNRGSVSGFSLRGGDIGQA